MSLLNNTTVMSLDDFLGKTIADFCSNGYTDTTDNHCAHFVCHALNLSFGMTCGQLVSASQRKNTGANVRVHELFARCPRVEELRQCPTVGSALIFVSEQRNFRGTPVELRNVPKKHVGILMNGRVWHYSNTQDKVVVQPASLFLFHYSGQQNALWIGELPPESMGAGLSCRAPLAAPFPGL
ncbi:MAG: hypothetical protein AB7Q17_17515 [Phycisphaerae bacterium]